MGFKDRALGSSGMGASLGVGGSLTVNPIKLETGSRPHSAGIPYTFLLRIEATGFPTFRLVL